jgi:hypothetical protein
MPGAPKIAASRRYSKLNKKLNKKLDDINNIYGYN